MPGAGAGGHGLFVAVTVVFHLFGGAGVVEVREVQVELAAAGEIHGDRIQVAGMVDVDQGEVRNAVAVQVEVELVLRGRAEHLCHLGVGFHFEAHAGEVADLAVDLGLLFDVVPDAVQGIHDALRVVLLQRRLHALAQSPPDELIEIGFVILGDLGIAGCILAVGIVKNGFGEAVSVHVDEIQVQFAAAGPVQGKGIGRSVAGGVHEGKVALAVAVEVQQDFILRARHDEFCDLRKCLQVFSEIGCDAH